MQFTFCPLRGLQVITQLKKEGGGGGYPMLTQRTHNPKQMYIDYHQLNKVTMYSWASFASKSQQ